MKIDRTTRYAKSVVAGNMVAGELVILACKRHLEDLKKAKKKKFPYYFDEAGAQKNFDFFEKLLKQSKGEWKGQNIVLEPWEDFIQGSIYGWKHKETDYRRYKEAYVQIAKKNGKSLVSSGNGLYGLTMDNEGGAEIYAAATKRDQARIIFDEAKNMVLQSPSLAKHLDVLKTNISMPMLGSKFEALSSDLRSMDGYNVHMGLIDELHAHPSRETYDLISDGVAARRQPLILTTTTAGHNPNGICKDRYDYCVKILKGAITDETTFAYIAQLDEGDNWRDEKNWIKANPNLGVSVKLDYLRRKCNTAKEMKSAQNNFLIKHMNMWVSGEHAWVDIMKWNNMPVHEVDLKDRPCVVGVDLSATTDLTAVCHEFWLDDGYFYINVMGFMPEGRVLEAEKRDGVPYSVWIEEGYMIATPGDVVDYEWIQDYIMSRDDPEGEYRWKTQEICVDPWNATQFNNNMDNEGFTIVETRQGFKTISPSMKDLEVLFMQGKIIHNNNPLLTWNMSNVVSVMDPAGNIKFDKSKSKYRIDGAAAFITGHTRAMIKPSHSKVSKYESSGLTVL